MTDNKRIALFSKDELFLPKTYFADVMYGYIGPNHSYSGAVMNQGDEIQQALLSLRLFKHDNNIRRKRARDGMRVLHSFILANAKKPECADIIQRIGKAMGVHERSLMIEHSLRIKSPKITF